MILMLRQILAPVAAALLLVATSSARAQYRPDLPDTSTPAPIPNLPIVEKPNAQIPLDLDFTRSDGTPIKLADAFHHNKPVILSLVYFSCPMLCGLNQDSLLAFVREAPHGIQLGKDYDILVVSIDADDTPKDAAIKRKAYLAKVPLPESQPGFTYLTGSKASIKSLADTVGFPFTINPPGGDSGKIAHDTGIFVCTPDGRLSQTILGVNYQSETLFSSLGTASDGKIGSGFLSFALSCGAIFRHRSAWWWTVTAGGTTSILFVATFLTMMWRGESKRKKLSAPPSDARLNDLTT